ncbi:diacylglycerol kinase [Thalassoglobus sp. JC818]|uniref:diacylglycerol kinase n=1 Tax=Thalassoglobus sp. JC818 TaxID=3232136 RepID=UPI00345968F6
MQISRANRPAWRQRLVDAETGFRIGLRTDSTLFMYLFVGIGVLFSGFVFRLSVIEWTILVLTLGLTLSVELFHQLLRLIVHEFRHHIGQNLNQILRLGTAAVVATNVSAIIVLLILFGSRIVEAIG